MLYETYYVNRLLLKSQLSPLGVMDVQFHPLNDFSPIQAENPHDAFRIANERFPQFHGRLAVGEYRVS